MKKKWKIEDIEGWNFDYSVYSCDDWEYIVFGVEVLERNEDLGIDEKYLVVDVMGIEGMRDEDDLEKFVYELEGLDLMGRLEECGVIEKRNDMSYKGEGDYYDMNEEGDKWKEVVREYGEGGKRMSEMV